MPTTKIALQKLSKALVFTHAEAIQAGVSAPTIKRLLDAGQINKSARGVYYKITDANSDPSDIPEIEYRTASKIFGKSSYVGGHTALLHYRLCIDIPQTTDVIVPQSMRTKRSPFRALRTKLNLDIGVFEKNGYRLATIERAILDAMYFSHLWDNKGFPLAMLVNAIRTRETNTSKIREMAKDLGISSIFQTFESYLHREIVEPV